MGIYQYTDPQTQRSYNFEIAGDNPSNEDFAKIQQYLEGERADYGQRYQDVFGEEFQADNETAVRRGLRRGYQQIKSAVGETVGTAGEQFGLGFLSQYGQDTEEKARQRLGELLLEQPERLQSTDVDSISSALTYAGEVVGEQIPQLGLGLGAAAAAPLVGATGFVGGAAAAAVTTAPILFGNNIQRQEDEVAAGKKASVDVGAALTATFGQAALEGIADKILLGGAFRPIGKSIFTRTASRATGGATTEGLTEVGQQILERSQAGLPIDSDDAIAEYREAAIAGGLIGGGTRATFGALQGVPGDTTVTERTETTPTVVPDDTTQAIEEAVDEAVGAAAEAEVAAEAETQPTATTAAQQKEADNAADPTPPTGRAEATESERALQTAEAITNTDRAAAIERDETNKVGRMQRIADKYIASKPDPDVVAEDKTAAIESEQTGEQIEVDQTPEPIAVDTEQEQTPEPATVTPQEQTIDDEFLANLSVPKQALIRREGTKKSLIGKKVSDEGVLDELRNYAKISSIPEARDGVQGFLDSLEVEDARTGPESEGVGTSIPDSQPSVVGSRGRDSGVIDTAEPAAPDAGPVGTDMLDTDGVDASTGVQRDTLEEVPQEQVQELQQAVEQATATPVAPQPTPQPTPQPATQAPATPAMQQAAIPGQTTGAAAQQIPAPVAPAPREEQVQAAPVPQEELQAAEQARSTAAQSEINRRFQKQPAAIQEYYGLAVEDEQDATVLPDTTTALDKEAVVELLSATKKNLDDNQKAARMYFERFRRPVEALSEIGALTVVGPKKTFKKDYKTPEQLKFYTGLTQGSALNARKWVFDNMSSQANEVMRTARVQAKRGSSKPNPSDAYVTTTGGYKARKFASASTVAQTAIKIIDSEREAFNKQLTREANEFTEASRAAAAAKKMQLSEEMAGREGIQGVNQELFRVTKPIKGETAFDAYLLSMGFKKRKVPKQDDYFFFDPEDNNRKLTDEELMDFYDGWAASRDLGFLLVDPVHGLDLALTPSVKNALEQGNLRAALFGIAETTDVERISSIAAKLAETVGDTRIQVVDNLSQSVGRTAAGLFDPETNTIQIDASRGMNVHTILHEMTHAATSAAVANPSLPETKQLQSILEAVRGQFGEVYGTQNLDEFVAEAFSNPEFQSALALTKLDGNQSAWNKFTGAVLRIVRKILGMSPSGDTLAEVDRLIEGLLSPSPDTRAAPNLLLEAGTSEGSGRLAQSLANFNAKDKVLDAKDVMFNEGVGKTAKSWYLNTLPVNILTEKAQDKIPFARELNTIINRMSGRLREKTEMLGSMTGELKGWQRKNKKHSQTLNNLIPRSTFLQVDPSRTDKKYMEKINEKRETQQEYKELRKQYLSMDKQGQEFYRQLRNYFQDTYNDILEALDARLEASIPDAEARKTAFARLRELLQKDSGIITPYFPLQRKGNYRLSYNAPDPDTGQPETFVEYYPTLRKAQQARDLVSGMGGTDTQITEASKAMNFDRAPSTSFVRNVLETVQLQRSNFKTDEDYKMAMQAMVDLALDAMPERSFMQNFRRRKGVRGFIGDTTPTGIMGQEFDAYTMLKEKGRDLNRQLVQMRSAAEIEGFRKKLADPEAGYLSNPETSMTAEKLDKIAQFAASPNVPRWSQIATSLGFGWTMGLNFSSAAITFFDVAMSAMPILAGKHGIGSTTSAYGDAMRALMGAPTVRTVMVTGPDGEPVAQEVNMGVQGKTIANYTPEQLREVFGDVRMDILVEKGLDQAQFNQSITQENLEIGRDAPLETMNRVSSFLFHHSERINRETTLTAAYLLEVKKLRKERGELKETDYAEAAQNAIDDTEFTLGATAAAGRPIVAQSGIGNVLFLFKRFAISKYYMMERLARDAAKGDKVALAQARNFLVMTGLLSGLGGMPLMGTFGAIFNMLRDDDEDDFEAATRKLVGEGIYGGLANELLGVDVANRISMNSLLYRAPIIDKDQDFLWTLAEQLGGPVLGSYLSASRGVQDIRQGEVRRGLESMVPAAFRNASKAERFAREGATTRRGDPITEDINPYNVVMQGLGFAPQGYVQQLEFNKNNRRRQEAIDSRRGKLLRRRNMAMREGDFEEVRNIDQKIKEFNEGLPRGAEKSRITSDTIQRSMRSFGRTTDKMRGGMTYTPFMERSLKEFDQGLRLF